MTNINKITKLVAVYARVSTEHQEKEETVKNQLEVIRERAREEGWTIVKEYIDDGWSGGMLARPALDKLRQDADQGMWEAVVIYDPDRLARKFAYQALVAEELQGKKIEMIYITVKAPENDEENLFHGMRGLFAEYERMKIRERFRIGKLRKLKQGQVMVSEAPYGYRYVKIEEDNGGRYEIDPVEARVMKMIFSWVGNDGMTLRGVVRKLKEMGIKPRKSKRGVWNTTTLGTLLRNETFIGKAHWGSTVAVEPEKPLKEEKYKKVRKTSRRKRSKEDWVYVDVPPLIDKELFDRVGAQLKKNFAQCKRNKKNKYLLSGLMECVCGTVRAGEGPQKGKYLYYRCSNRVYNYPLPRTCDEGGVNARIADKMVWKKLTELMSSPGLMRSQTERFLKDSQEKVEVEFADVEVLEREIKKLEGEEARYSKAYGAGVFSLKQLEEYTAPLQKRIASLKEQISKAVQEKEKVNVDAIADEEQIRTFAKRATDMLKELGFEKRRKIVLEAIDRIVASQSHLQVYGKIPVTQYVKQNTITRNCWFAQRREIDTV